MAIISHKHRFVFLKPRKTAGTSLEAALAQFCGPDDVIASARDEAEFGVERQNRNPERIGLKHHKRFCQELLRTRLLDRPPEQPSLQEIRRRAYAYKIEEHIDAPQLRLWVGDELWNSYTKIAFARNPWDRLVSFYYWRTRNLKPRPPFKEFAKAALVGDKRTQKRLKARSFYIKSYFVIDGRPCIDFLGRFEDLEQDAKHVFDQLGLPWANALPRAKGTFRSHRDYHDFYDDELIELTNEMFRWEIEFFGYAL